MPDVAKEGLVRPAVQTGLDDVRIGKITTIGRSRHAPSVNGSHHLDTRSAGTPRAPTTATEKIYATNRHQGRFVTG